MGVLGQLPVSDSGAMGDQEPSSPVSDSGISSASSLSPQMSLIEDCPSKAVQRGYSFLRDRIHEEEQLIGYLCVVCETRQLSDEEKLEMRKGGGCHLKQKLIKQLVKKGDEACKAFLDKLKHFHCLYTQFCQTMESEMRNVLLCIKYVLLLAITEYTQSTPVLTPEQWRYHEDTLIEEMEPSLISDVLFCHCALSLSDLDELEKHRERKKKAKAVIVKIRQEDKMHALWRALEITKCYKAIEHIRGNVCDQHGSVPSDSVSCVRFNYRNLLTEFKTEERRQIVFDHLREEIFQHLNALPKVNHLIKTSLRQEGTGCESLLMFLKEVNNGFLRQMTARLDHRRKNGRETIHREHSISYEKLRTLESYLLEELEPMPVSNVMLEERAFSLDIHDSIEEQKGRRKRSEAVYNRLLTDRSELTLESFLFALWENKSEHILNTFRRARVGQITQTEQRNLDEDDDNELPGLQIVPVGGGMQLSEDIEFSSDVEMILSIPVEGEREVIQQAVDRINNDPQLKARVTETSHMKIDRAEVGSVILHLIPVTDDACHRFLDEKGKHLKKMVEKLLSAAGIKEEQIKGNISVKVFASEKAGELDEHGIAEMKIREKWNLLLEELEPIILAASLKTKGIFTEDDEKNFIDDSTRREKVEKLLITLLASKREDNIDQFIESLNELGREDIALEIKPEPNMHEEAEKVRKGLLHKFRTVIDEMESSIIEETLKRCGIESEAKLSSKLGKSRKERAYNFLVSVLLNDMYVLALKHVLEDQDLNELFELPEEIESSFGTKRKHPENVQEGDILFQCEYKLLKKEEKGQYVWSTFLITYIERSAEEIPKSSSFHEEMEFSRETDMTPKSSSSSEAIVYMRETEMKSEIKSDPLSSRQTVKQTTVYTRKKVLQPKRSPVQRSQVPGKIYGRPCSEKGEDEWSIVVALDFGTTYSGFAVWRKENPSEIYPGKWKTNSTEVLESLKTPTSLLLNKNNELIEFGFEAERIFKELLEDGCDSDYRFFSKFKMFLHQKQTFDKEMEIKDHLGHSAKAIDVFFIAIKYLKDECTLLLNEKNMMVADEEIRWILTVPAIWDESAKQFMRKAAERAEIPSHQLKLALEPEAAAIYVIKESKQVLGIESLTTYQPGAKIMLADLGGGTADFTVLELMEDRKMKQLYRASGGAWGGNMVNEKIWKMLENIFGRDVILEFKKQTADYMEMEYNIELKKRDLTLESRLQLPIFPSFSDLCRSLRGKTYKNLVQESPFADIVKVRVGKLVFEPKMVEKIFDMTLSHLFVTVEKILESPSTHGVKDIILVGGFSQSEIIVKQFEKRFRKYKVIIPTDPGLAVLKGAVMFGQDINIITSRISPHTYGFDTMQYFMTGDPQNKRKKIDDTYYCVDIFEKMVAIGESVDVGKTVEKEVFAASAEMTKMVLKFYQSNEENPQFVTDKGCECIGELLVDMPDVRGGKERSVLVSIKFGETEIMVCGVDKTTGNRQETKLDLLGRNY
ncbi:uncharacterized protein LOC133173581 [Saccostrea echinata]|uniref:uncharacterized protein LOC133173581 n=1 Tax=Saccostrea echinata TaxID=191078 RepID=UPI002A8130AB|nr:uncharacterized protein LOC133173581 [Saccostrea echinata]